MGDTLLGDVVALDVPRARAIGRACTGLGAAAGVLANHVAALLAAALQSSRAARLLAEVQAELGSLGRVIDGTVDLAVAADRWTPVTSSEFSGLVSTVSASRSLWNSLNDSVGTTALDVGVFDMAGSLRTMTESEWRGAMVPPGCGSFGAGRFYGGGGAVLGPDDRLYPIVVPHLVLDGEHHFTIDADIGPDTPTAASLGGADPGWTMVAYRTGVERVITQPGWAQRVAVGLAVATGLEIGAALADSELVGVRLSPGRRPSFEGSAPVQAPVDTAGGAALESPVPTVWSVIDGRAAQYPIDELSDRGLDLSEFGSVPSTDHTSLGRFNTADNALTLWSGAMSGFVAARDLDDGRHRAYEVVFEQNADGRRRARVQTFTLESGASGPALYGWHLFLDDDGYLHQSPVSYQTVPSLASGSQLLAYNPFDPDYTSRLPDAAFGGEPG